MGATLTATWKCDKCGEQVVHAEEGLPVMHSYMVDLPSEAKGWRWQGKKLLCVKCLPQDNTSHARNYLHSLPSGDNMLYRGVPLTQFSAHELRKIIRYQSDLYQSCGIRCE